jgi:hypothetical protein
VQGSILPQLSRIRAISFDGDMTLWDFDKVMRRSLAYALAELRRARPGGASAKLTIDKMIEIRDAVSEELKGRLSALSRFGWRHLSAQSLRWVKLAISSRSTLTLCI